MFWIYEGFAALVATPVTNIMLTVVLTLFAIGVGLAILYYGLPVLWRICKWIFSGRAFRDVFAVCMLCVYGVLWPFRVLRMTRHALSKDFDDLPRNEEKKALLQSAMNQCGALFFLCVIAYVACFFIDSPLAVLCIMPLCALLLLCLWRGYRINRKLKQEFNGG